jgi:hypothetical protein
LMVSCSVEQRLGGGDKVTAIENWIEPGIRVQGSSGKERTTGLISETTAMT